MTTCEKHGCQLKELLTSTYCPRCDEEAAVNAGVSKIMKHVYSHDSDGKELRYQSEPVPTPNAGIGWYHNYPVCGTDANGSDVTIGVDYGNGADDMDVCMGLRVKELEQRIRQAQETPQPDVCMGMRERAPMTVAVKIESITMWLDAGLIDEATALAWLVHV